MVFAAIGLLVPLPFGGRITPAIGDMVHAPLFGFLTLVSSVFWNRVRPLGKHPPIKSLVSRTLLCGMIVFLFGIASEIGQTVSGRTAAVHDAFANSSGIFTVTALIVTLTLAKRGEFSSWLTCVIVLLSLLPVGMSWWNPVATLYDVYRTQRDFPLLSSFERAAELERWHFANSSGELSKRFVHDGRYSLRADYAPSEHPTVTLFDIPGDWNAMDALSLSLTLSEKHVAESVRVAVQVIDSDHSPMFTDVYRREWILHRGRTLLAKIPCSDLRDSSGDLLDLGRIRYLDVQLVRPELATTVFIDNIRLIPKVLD